MAIKTYYAVKKYDTDALKHTPFYVEDLSGETNTVYIAKANGNAPSNTIEYSTDLTTWTTLGTSTSTDTPLTLTLPANSRVYFRCSYVNGGYQFYWSFGQSIVCGKWFAAGGNIASLIYGSNFTGNETTVSQASSMNTFTRLFYPYNGTTSQNGGYKLLSAKNLILPFTQLKPYMYERMFYDCGLLRYAPLEIPATTLADYCCQSMFYNCKSLITAPKLPATTLAQYCYNQMFYQCQSLSINHITLPATTLASNCYTGMFNRCYGLYSITLPATTLVSGCYNTMLNRSGVRFVEVGATSWDESSTSGWVGGVENLGEFTKPTNTTIPTGSNGIPSGWTVVNK